MLFSTSTATRKEWSQHRLHIDTCEAQEWSHLREGHGEPWWHYLSHLARVWQTFFEKGCIANILGFSGYNVFRESTWYCCCSFKAAVDSMLKNKHDNVPMKCHLGKHAIAYSLPTPALGQALVRPKTRQPGDSSVRFATKFFLCFRLVWVFTMKRVLVQVSIW